MSQDSFSGLFYAGWMHVFLLAVVLTFLLRLACKPVRAVYKMIKQISSEEFRQFLVVGVMHLVVQTLKAYVFARTVTVTRTYGVWGFHLSLVTAYSFDWSSSYGLQMFTLFFVSFALLTHSFDSLKAIQPSINSFLSWFVKLEEPNKFENLMWSTYLSQTFVQVIFIVSCFLSKERQRCLLATIRQQVDEGARFLKKCDENRGDANQLLAIQGGNNGQGIAQQAGANNAQANAQQQANANNPPAPANAQQQQGANNAHGLMIPADSLQWPRIFTILPKPVRDLVAYCFEFDKAPNSWYGWVLIVYWFFVKIFDYLMQMPQYDCVLKDKVAIMLCYVMLELMVETPKITQPAFKKEALGHINQSSDHKPYLWPPLVLIGGLWVLCEIKRRVEQQGKHT